jgi:hypothetical protein
VIHSRFWSSRTKLVRNLILSVSGSGKANYRARRYLSQTSNAQTPTECINGCPKCVFFPYFDGLYPIYTCGCLHVSYYLVPSYGCFPTTGLFLRGTNLTLLSIVFVCLYLSFQLSSPLYLHTIHDLYDTIYKRADGAKPADQG